VEEPINQLEIKKRYKMLVFFFVFKALNVTSTPKRNSIIKKKHKTSFHNQIRFPTSELMSSIRLNSNYYTRFHTNFLVKSLILVLIFIVFSVYIFKVLCISK
jgi:hypothetical protein